jgi:hypothetical protein
MSELLNEQLLLTALATVAARSPRSRAAII